jgi:hypothetical protein
MTAGTAVTEAVAPAAPAEAQAAAAVAEAPCSRVAAAATAGPEVQTEPATTADQKIQQAGLPAAACPAGDSVVDALQMDGREEQQASQQNSKPLNTSPGEHECCRLESAVHLCHKPKQQLASLNACSVPRCCALLLQLQTYRHDMTKLLLNPCAMQSHVQQQPMQQSSQQHLQQAQSSRQLLVSLALR